MKNTPMDIKLSLSRRIFDQNKKKIQILNHLCKHDGMGKKTISRYCPFNHLAPMKWVLLTQKNSQTLKNLKDVCESSLVGGTGIFPPIY
jgi:hypothetical protein